MCTYRYESTSKSRVVINMGLLWFNSSRLNSVEVFKGNDVRTNFFPFNFIKRKNYAIEYFLQPIVLYISVLNEYFDWQSARTPSKDVYNG